MTVASLWKALDRAGCGKPVGTEGLLDHERLKQATNPWNYNDRQGKKRPTLAIDLSIWICESLTSSAMAENHADPTLHLVFARTVKLLTLGVKIIGVIEGKRRLRDEGKSDEFQKRRSGTRFWVACRRCEEMFGLLGVPVVRAKAEGEALCALLNQKGIVDGVISNDGDCFLFGAKVLYTKFSIENLNEGRVMRYDALDLVACLDDDDSDNFGAISRSKNAAPSPDIVRLNRIELMVFAILTGSDVAGSGLSKVGCRKALRFIRKCQIDNPLRSDTAAFDELLSWAKAAHAMTPKAMEEGSLEKKCSVCCHSGTKSSHHKHGCELCGTSPGEPCFQLSPGGKFRKSLRAKALAMGSHFDPEMVAKVYRSPNDDQIPCPFIGRTSRDIIMKTPDLQAFLKSSLIIRGRSYAESRGYVLQALSRLLARSELSSNYKPTEPMKSNSSSLLPINRNKPIPTKVVKAVSRSSVACFEVLWTIKATITDAEGNPVDEFEFSTVEEQSIVKKCYPDLVDKFISNENERLKQGTAEQERRRAFLESMTKHDSESSGEGLLGANHKKVTTSGREFFARNENCRALTKGNRSVKNVRKFSNMGDDAARLLQGVTGNTYDPRRNGNSDHDSIETISTISSGSSRLHEHSKQPHHKTSSSAMKDNSPYKFILSPGHLHFLCAPVLPPRYEDSMRNGFKERDGQYAFKSQQGLEDCYSKAAYLDEYFGEKQSGFSVQEAPRRNSSRSPGLFDRSPYLKRSRVTSTPPLVDKARDLYVRSSMDYKFSLAQDLKSHCEAEPLPQRALYFGSPNREWDGRFEKSAIEENHAITNFEYQPLESRPLSPGLFYEQELEDNQERFQFTFKDDCLLNDSFAAVSIHSICSPRQRVMPQPSPIGRLYEQERETPLLRFTPRDDSNVKWLTPAFFTQPCYSSETPHLSTNEHSRTNLDVAGFDVVETATAKWEHKSLLAKMNDENCQLVRNALGYDYRSSFEET